MRVLTANNWGKNLIDALGLPARCKTLEIKISAGEPVVVKVEYFATEDVGKIIDGEFETVMKEYELHERVSPLAEGALREITTADEG